MVVFFGVLVVFLCFLVFSCSFLMFSGSCLVFSCSFLSFIAKFDQKSDLVMSGPILDKAFVCPSRWMPLMAATHRMVFCLEFFLDFLEFF